MLRPLWFPLLAGSVVLAACSSESSDDHVGAVLGEQPDAQETGDQGSTPSAPLGEQPDAQGTGDQGAAPSDDAAGMMAGDEGHAELDGGAGCNVKVEQHEIEGANHAAFCSPLVYRTNPPSSGNHYGSWAAYQTYSAPVPVGFWVHDLEHGAVVITYNCPEGCAGEVAQVQALIDSLPSDCAGAPSRIVLTPYPGLEVRFAASAWGFTLRADCFDRDAFAAFIAAHRGRGPEDVCGGGFDPLTAGPTGGPICPN